MNKWQETVKRVSKQHPGKSLTYILPIAKVEYRKMGHGSTKSAKKGRKGRKDHKRLQPLNNYYICRISIHMHNT